METTRTKDGLIYSVRKKKCLTAKIANEGISCVARIIQDGWKINY